ncbi:acyltransferase [Marinobacterium sp. LSUCC0821]|uniref:acyltransferase family protein n=1 Tax=Marinobacterium sp. LSUCC0821 TaxID=2668067 RepID=UPI0014520078|nr:acyltransferase [Marinobacterium sp. LSUCC0821]QJD72174.1 acyltransferase [Marinobacterium sp. LSUCC0821]
MNYKPVNNRFDYLDGLRGLAALVVVFGHFWPYESLRAIPLLNIFFDTKLAVAIFFVLSGVVLSHSASKYEINFRWLSYSIFTRYIRLMIPILLVTLIALIFFELDLFFNDNIPSSFGAWKGYDIFYRFKHDLFDGLLFATYNVFFDYDAQHTYIPPAWTMRPELFASTILFLFIWILSLLRKSNISLFLLLCLSLFVFLSRFYLPGLYYFSYFLVGYILYALYLKPSCNFIIPFWAFILWVLFKSVILMFSINSLFIDFVLASVLIVIVMFNPIVKKFLTKGVFLYLGYISFPLYLVHSPLISSFGLYNFTWLGFTGFSVVVCAVINFILLMVPVLILSHGLAYVDKININLIKAAANKIVVKL